MNIIVGILIGLISSGMWVLIASVLAGVITDVNVWAIASLFALAIVILSAILTYKLYIFVS